MTESFAQLVELAKRPADDPEQQSLLANIANHADADEILDRFRAGSVLDTRDDLDWLTDTQGIDTSGYRAAVLYGNDDSPDAIALYKENNIAFVPTIYLQDDDGEFQLAYHGSDDKVWEAKRPKDSQGQYRLQDLVPRYSARLIWTDDNEYLMAPRRYSDVAEAVAAITSRWMSEITSGWSDPDIIEWEVTDQWGKVHASSREKKQEAKRPPEEVGQQYLFSGQQIHNPESQEQILHPRDWHHSYSQNAGGVVFDQWRNEHGGELQIISTPISGTIILYQGEYTVPTRIDDATLDDVAKAADQVDTDRQQALRQLAQDVGAEFEEAKRPPRDPGQMDLFHGFIPLAEEDPAIGHFDGRVYPGAYFEDPEGQMGEWTELTFDEYFDDAVSRTAEQLNYSLQDDPGAKAEIMFYSEPLGYFVAWWDVDSIGNAELSSAEPSWLEAMQNAGYDTEQLKTKLPDPRSAMGEAKRPASDPDQSDLFSTGTLELKSNEQVEAILSKHHWENVYWDTERAEVSLGSTLPMDACFTVWMPVFSGVAGQRYGDDRIAIGEPSVSVYQRAAGLRDPDSEFLDCEEVFLISAGIEADEDIGAKGWGGEIRTEHELEIFLKRVEQRIISKGGSMGYPAGESMEKVCLESWQSRIAPVLKILYGLHIDDLKPEALSEAFEQGVSPQKFVEHLGEKHKLFKVREVRRLRRPDAPAPDEQEVLFPKEPPADVAPARQRLMPWTETKWLALWYDPATGQNNIDDPDRDYYDTEQEALESADELADAYLGREVQQDYESPEGRVEQAIEYRKSLMRIYAETVEIDVGGPYLLTRSYPAEVGDNVVHWSTVEVGTYPSVAEAVAAGNEWLLQARKTKPEAYFEIKDADDNKVEI